ncbi:MAG TPA: glycosyltransferase family 39 protein [Candidatus Levybacteria bacterium]|nr:glycosyltransferase family 39 protein [Candidatus Levybacteria bacterium]
MNNIKKYIKKNKLQLAILCVIIICALYLRMGGVLTKSFAYTYDVGRDLIQVQKIVGEHKIPLIGQTTGLGGLYYGPWWYYILTPPFVISQGNPQGIVFFMVLTGIATIICGYIYGRKVSGKWLGIIIAAILGLSSAMVGLSSQIWNPNIAPLVLLILFLVLPLTRQEKNSIFKKIWIGILLGLLLDAEIVFGVLIIASVIIFLLLIEKKRFFTFPSMGLVIGLFVMVLPRIVFELRHDFIMTKSLLIKHSGDQRIFEPFQFFEVVPDRYITFLNQFSDTFGVNNTMSVLILIVCFLTLFLLRKTIQKKEKGVIVLCVVTITTFFLGSAVFARAVWGHYLVALPVVYIIFVSLSFYILARKHMIIGICIIILLCLSSVRLPGIIDSIKNPYWEGNAAVYRNQEAVIDFIYKDANNRPFNYIAYTPVVHDFTYQYLFSWYGMKTYGYTPRQKRADLFYVIIEPDFGNEYRITDWLKIREKDGKILDEKVIKGGIKVQMRNH